MADISRSEAIWLAGFGGLALGLIIGMSIGIRLLPASPPAAVTAPVTAPPPAAAVPVRTGGPEHQRRELALFGMRATGLRVDLAAVKNVPTEAETREVVETGINLNGLLCARVVSIRALKLDGAYEVDCIEYRNGTATKTYVIHAHRGFAFVP